MTARTGARAVSLADGRVLRVGGRVLGLRPGPDPAVAELYEPDSGWVPSARLTVPRADPAVVRLASGDVLVSGGRSPRGPYPQGVLGQAEIWSQDTQRFAPTGSMHEPRWDHAAVLLPSGSVLVVGGQARGGAALGSTESFNPETGTWTRESPLPRPTPDPSADVLPNGAIVVSSSAGLFLRTGSPATWTVLSDVSRPHSRVLGSSDCMAFVLDAFAMEAWDLQTGRRVQRSSPIVARTAPALVRLDSRRVLVVGGHASGDLDRTSEIWTRGSTAPASTLPLTWRLLEHVDSVEPGQLEAVVPLGPGRILGLSASVPPWIAELEHRTITALALPAEPVRHGAAIARVDAEHVLVVGGIRVDPTMAEVEVPQLIDRIGPARMLGLEPPAWREVSPPRLARWNATATALGDSAIVLIGGVATDRPTREIERWDRASDRWRRVGRLAHGRVGHTATPRPDGVFVVGGCDLRLSDPLATEATAAGAAGRATELWQRAQERVVSAGTLHDERCGHIAVALRDGRVLVAGGFERGTFASWDAPTGQRRLVSVEIWDPATRSWHPAAPMRAARALAAGARLDDGRVLVLGGQEPDASTLPSAELYDPVDDTWEELGPLPRHWSRPSLVVADGTRVLLFADGLDFELRVAPPTISP